jgi:hypothetical protein
MDRWALAVALLVVSPAFAGEAFLFFDPRQPYARPLLRTRVGDRVQMMVFDTGADAHVWSLEQAKRAGVKLSPAEPFRDVAMRLRVAYRADVPLTVDGLQVDHAGPLRVSEWADVKDSSFSFGPHADGVLSGNRLAGNRALMVSVPHARVLRASWNEALTQLAATDLVWIADGQADGHHYVVSAQVGADTVRLVIDTGAPGSLVYLPPGAELPPGTTRHGSRSARIRIGRFVRDVRLATLEVGTPPGIDGLIGMDVLRDCGFAIDRTRLSLHCRGGELGGHGDSAVTLAASNPVRTKRVCVSEQTCLTPRADGSYRYVGDRVVAHVSPDGSFHIQTLDTGLGMRTSREETEQFLEATRLFRYEMMHARDLRLSFERFPRHLASVWHDDALTTAARREILFLLWDECAEPDDPELGAAGQLARRTMEQFIRHKLPRGSANGFTEAELARMNARRARGPSFRPYEVKDRE